MLIHLKRIGGIPNMIRSFKSNKQYHGYKNNIINNNLHF